ncbi:MAG TPA: DNA-binding response regulator [Blastocatellia bacterium]|jgi:two-component system copper resistance phosphate regulon response regulator CusR|nr:DNA-binding response regulator [Blastocatellia bacterium]HCX29451.1 DNA-binding response regulator [Blastocatellia bacterium]
MRILLVEDEPRMVQVIAKGLREHAYAVDVVGDGDAALYQAAVNDYDLIILDVMLPGRDGFEVCRELRARGDATPVLMLTARATVDDRIAGLDSGADDYLTKPFSFRELLARLRALSRRGNEVRPDQIQVEDLIIDVAGQKVFRAGRQIELTAKEYSLLEHLARHAGQVVSRAEIAEHVWDQSFDPFSNTIEVFVNRLRKKVDDQRAVKLIHTRRGQGYILEPHSDGSPS